MQHGRRRVPGAAPLQRAGRDVEVAEEQRRQRPAGHPRDEVVEGVDGLARRQALQGVRPHRRPQLTHHQRAGQALAGDVADAHRDPAVGELEHVVPVAADLHLLLGGAVRRRQLQAGQLREALGQQEALQGRRDRRVALDVPGLLDDGRQDPGQRDEQRSRLGPQRLGGGQPGGQRAEVAPAPAADGDAQHLVVGDPVLATRRPGQGRDVLAGERRPAPRGRAAPRGPAR